MESSRLIIIFCSLLLSLATLTFSDSDDPYFECQYAQNKGNYTANSPYYSNLRSILSRLSSTSDFKYGFHNLSTGKNPNKVFVIALCRGDQTAVQCRRCYNYTITKLFKDCPGGKEVVAWSEFCMVRFANRNIFRQLDNDPHVCRSNSNQVANVANFSRTLLNKLGNLSNEAAMGGPLRKFAFDNAESFFQTIHVIVQCTPDLNSENCSNCLNSGLSELRNCCPARLGCRILRPSCNIRYEIGQLFNQTPIPLPSPPSSSRGNNNDTTRIIIIVIASVVGVLLLIILSALCIYSRQGKKLKGVETKDDITSVESLQFDFQSVVDATNNFSAANKLGQGGFGAVYKGQLSDGQEIAVKRLSMDSGQGDLEFKNEVLLMAKLDHRNLVRLHGFCLEGQERLLIYEFVPNGSLNHLIFDPIKRAKLDWGNRYKIIEGIARGLVYLHEDSRFRIIHRDLKPSNILLDVEMNSKIADFGMARLFAQDETRGNTSRVVGTYGYMAPEYISHGQFSVKTDVFSFGVLILEIISGQKSNHQGENNVYLLNFAWKNWTAEKAWNIIDPNLSDGSRIEIMRCLQIGLLCVQENIASRPTMATVVLMLSNFSTSLPMPTQPAFTLQADNDSEISSSLGTDTSASESNLPKNEPISQNELSISELTPR